MCAIFRPTKTHFVAEVVEPRGWKWNWTAVVCAVDRRAFAICTSPCGAIAAQLKEEKMIARQADQMGCGRGCLAGVVWMNLDRAAGRGCQIRPVSGSDVLVEGQRPVDKPSCVRRRPFGQVHTRTQTRNGR